jgi:aminoglycoside phosphotransferase (APT) family kinase protein
MAEWDPEVHVDEDLARALIGGQAPDLRDAPIRLLAAGWDNVVYLVDDRWAFRFPRREVAVAGVEREISTLPRIAPNLPLPIPEPRYVGRPSGDYPWPWFGAPFLPGIELAAAGIPDDQRGPLAATLGAFLAALHAPAMAVRIGAGLPIDPMRRADMGFRVPGTRARIDGLASKRLWQPTHEVSRLLADAERLPPPSRTVLLHGDLHVRHVLVDERGGAAGVIDWGDLCVGDPSIDLSLGYGSFAGGARRAFLAAYGPVDGLTELRARVVAVFLAAALLEYAEDVSLAGLRAEAVRALDRAVA